MSAIQVSATAGPDGVLHLSIPVGVAGAEYDVVVRPKPARTPTPEELGWPPGFFQTVIGSIDDDTFQAPPRRTSKPIPPLDSDE